MPVSGVGTPMRDWVGIWAEGGHSHGCRVIVCVPIIELGVVARSQVAVCDEDDVWVLGFDRLGEDVIILLVVRSPAVLQKNPEP